MLALIARFAISPASRRTSHGHLGSANPVHPPGECRRSKSTPTVTAGATRRRTRRATGSRRRCRSRAPAGCRTRTTSLGNNNSNDCRKDCQFNRCGDGFTNAQPGLRHEDCDTDDPLDPESKQQETAQCNIDCTSAHCGDGKVNKSAGEECDDGVNNGDDKDCTRACKVNVCGDGHPNLVGPAHKEECDDGNRDDSDSCTNHCTNAGCGDGVLRVGEQCDDGNLLDGDGCSHDCKREFCGDGILNNGEACDRAKTPPRRNLDCTISSCGDGKLNAFAVPPEQCDDHNTLDGDGCSATCAFEFCGDGQVNNHEACDPSVDPAHCNLDCTTSVCGDGKLNAAAGEQCDDHNTVGGDGCSATCTFEHCGNGVVDSGEECDGLAGPQPCSASCHREICGNGILDVDPANSIDEQCDLGAANHDAGVCTATCQLARCGDALIEVGVEQCDDGETNNGDHQDCTGECRLNVCGDGLVDSIGPNHIEECDAGAANTDNPVCPYNTSCTACSTQCHTLTVEHQCGDGVVDVPDEVCDDHNTDACGSCSATCGVATSHRAFGFILAVSGAELADGETFTLDDGINPPSVFEFDTGDGVAQGNIAVAFTDQNTAAEVRQAIEAAIQQQHDAGSLLIAPNPDPSNTNDALALLAHDRPTSLGNHAIATDVAAQTFFVAGMVGGQGGNCNGGTSCGSNADCASNFCSAQHVCDTPQPLPGGSPAPHPATRTARRGH